MKVAISRRFGFTPREIGGSACHPSEARPAIEAPRDRARTLGRNPLAREGPWMGSASLGGFSFLRKNKDSRSARTDSHGRWLQNGGLHASLAATGAENEPLSLLGRYFGARWKHIVATVAFGALFCSRLVYEMSKNNTEKCFNAAQDRYGKN